MDNNILLEQICSAKNFTDCLYFCETMFHHLYAKPLEERSEMLASFAKLVDVNLNFEGLDRSMPDNIPDNAHRLNNVVRSLINFLTLRGYTEKLYYRNLWENIEMLFPDAPSDEISYCLFEIIMHIRTPYFELPERIIIKDDKFQEIVDSIDLSIQKLTFAVEISKDQRYKIELTSRVLKLLEDLNTSEEKAVFLVCFMNRLEKRFNERKANEASNKSKDSAPADNKPSDMVSTASTVSADNTTYGSFQLQEPVNDYTIIKEYSYPSINDDVYGFALIQRGDAIFLTDKGETLKQLDRIFELSESDVVKNLVAVLKRYGVNKQGNEFVIPISNWDENSSADENENENIKQSLLSLFSCVSFMLNMRIFYT